ncbi:MAG: HAMP domain-containing histidine kinase [Hamadaea sp.]|nr:HAMP domain-containing histidine kinase [Hamadaea sp.]NUT03549.1 HAMP domain-containing histidine kinase [Hamadaea sp.]
MTLVLAAVLLPLARLVQVLAADRALSAAVDKARNLEFLVTSVGPDDLAAAVDQANAELPSYPATVYLPDGTVLGVDAVRTPAVELAARGSSLTADGDGGWEVVGPVAGSAYAGIVVVRVFVGEDELARGVARTWTVLGVLGAGALLLAVLAGDWLTRAAVRPIRELAALSHQLASGRLAARSRVHGPPEVQAVAEGLNHLAGRIEDLLRQERESVADISHQLRTPLTALRLEVESTPGTAAIADHVATLEAAVTRVIEQARRSGESAAPAACDAALVVAERAEFWAALAEDQGRPVTTEIAAGPVLAGVAEAELRTCVDVLLGNVFAHTNDGVAYAVTLTSEGRLTVEDAGPGFDPSGVRRGQSGGGSTGLGLDIARRTARSSGGDLTVGRSHLGGARVVVDLGPPRQPAFAVR